MGNRQAVPPQPQPPAQNQNQDPNAQQPDWQQPHPQWQQNQVVPPGELGEAQPPLAAQVNNYGRRHARYFGHRPMPLYNPRRTRYTTAQKDNAIRLLNMGLSYRQVARTIGPHCSCGTPHRWRRAHVQQLERRRRMQEARRRQRW